ncbi:MAG: D-glycero-beta-D-manno-heptose 1-phosphate adenylyltransferase [Candidatus Omnitrophica bacterium]|nr:D-glycero-beta-D-manno-heptose 1-phosphate adenylyltransferase [Candidatus Omnitrophota bacterium]
MSDLVKKIVSVGSLKRKLIGLRGSGQKIAFTNGCFDILHFGHVSYLNAAKKTDRILIVGLNSDDSVRRLKGLGRPVNGELNRAGVLAGLSSVDFIVIFDEDTPQHLISQLKPDILIKGADWKGKEIAGADIVRQNGGKVELIKYLDGLSTSNIVRKIKGHA